MGRLMGGCNVFLRISVAIILVVDYCVAYGVGFGWHKDAILPLDISPKPRHDGNSLYNHRQWKKTHDLLIPNTQRRESADRFLRNYIFAKQLQRLKKSQSSALFRSGLEDLGRDYYNDFQEMPRTEDFDLPNKIHTNLPRLLPTLYNVATLIKLRQEEGERENSVHNFDETSAPFYFYPDTDRKVHIERKTPYSSPGLREINNIEEHFYDLNAHNPSHTVADVDFMTSKNAQKPVGSEVIKHAHSQWDLSPTSTLDLRAREQEPSQAAFGSFVDPLFKQESGNPLEGSFSSDTSGCDGIEGRRCTTNTDCSCYGLYICNAGQCSAIGSHSNPGKSSDIGGRWFELPEEPQK